MFRIRITLVTALVVALAAVAINSQAQPPAGGRGAGGGRGQRGGGPGGGPGGPGGWGGPGGPGGPGGDLIRLADNEAVAKELKLTDRQKTKIKQIAEEQNKKRGEFFQQFRQQTDAATNLAAQQAQAAALQQQQIDPNLDARGSGAGNPLAGALNQRGFQGPLYGGRVQGQQVDPAVQQQAAQFQGRQAARAVQAQGQEMMREAMQALQQQSENELARTLDKNQVKRLKEIQLQVQGPAPCSARTSPKGSRSTRISTPRSRPSWLKRIRPGTTSCKRTSSSCVPWCPTRLPAEILQLPADSPMPMRLPIRLPAEPRPPKLDRLAKLGKADAAVEADAAVPTGRTTGVSIAKPSRKPWSSLRLKPRWKKLARRCKRSRRSFAIASTPWFSRPWIDVR